MMWSPPGGAFAVDVPTKLSEEKHTFRDGSQSRFKSVKLFAGKKTGNSFLVYVLELVDEAKERSTKEKFKGLHFLIGGDDDHEFVETYLKVDGLSAKEIVYTQQNNRFGQVLA